jgi:UDP-MurNAc hydroxylase
VRFTILGHAGLLVEAAGVRLVCDPWIVGSCYWRSWWNYPPPRRELVAGLRPDLVYITHLHWDHFQGPSLRRFDRATRMLVPEAHFDRMVVDLRGLGFRNVEELPHGVTREVAPGLRLTSWQFGLALDSALAVQDGTTTLLDANDCKLMGWPLTRVVERHRPIDVVLRSHSSASFFPHCVDGVDASVKALRSSEDYCAEFLRFAVRCGARVAVPFASNHCFLHRETRRFNDTVTSPVDVELHVRRHGPPGLDCRVMVPGDTWSSEGGFVLSEHDWFTRRAERIEELAARHAARLEATYRREDGAHPDWTAFDRYFRGFLASLPWILRKAWPRRVLFRPRGATSAAWLVDVSRGRVESCAASEPDHDFALDVPAAVLNDCVRKRVFSSFTASKRLRFVVRRGGATQLVVFTTLLDLFESEYFPLRGLLRPRPRRVFLRRWREAALYARLLGRVALRRPLRPVELI